MYKLNLVQLVNVPTHVKGNNLDVLLSNTVIISDIFVQQNLPASLFSDHFVVSFYTNNHSLRPGKSPSLPKFIYNYTNADWEGMYSFFFCHDFFVWLHKMLSMYERTLKRLSIQQLDYWCLAYTCDHQNCLPPL